MTLSRVCSSFPIAIIRLEGDIVFYSSRNPTPVVSTAEACHFPVSLISLLRRSVRLELMIQIYHVEISPWSGEMPVDIVV
jgi:hypothetical protein